SNKSSGRSLRNRNSHATVERNRAQLARGELRPNLIQPITGGLGGWDWPDISLMRDAALRFHCRFALGSFDGSAARDRPIDPGACQIGLRSRIRTRPAASRLIEG